MYSSYKHHSTLKALVGIAPSRAITFMSDVYEGSISDKDIVVKSGLLDILNPGDLVIADRGFKIEDVLQSKKVSLNIPPFLMGINPSRRNVDETHCTCQNTCREGHRENEKLQNNQWTIATFSETSHKPNCACNWVFGQLPGTTCQVMLCLCC